MFWLDADTSTTDCRDLFYRTNEMRAIEMKQFQNVGCWAVGLSSLFVFSCGKNSMEGTATSSSDSSTRPDFAPSKRERRLDVNGDVQAEGPKRFTIPQSAPPYDLSDLTNFTSPPYVEKQELLPEAPSPEMRSSPLPPLVDIFISTRDQAQFFSRSIQQGVDAGFAGGVRAFSVYDTGAAGMKKISRCFATSRGEYILTRENECASVFAGVEQEVLGFVSSEGKIGELQLVRCFITESSKFLVSTDESKCPPKSSIIVTLGFVR